MTVAVQSTFAFVPSFVSVLAKPFVGFGRLLVRIAETNGRMRAVQHLHSLSDEELAHLGLKREEVVQRVFGATY